MKLTSREKIMIIALGIIVLLAGYYKFIFSVQKNEITKLEEKSEKYKIEIDKLENNETLIKKLVEDVKIQNAKIIGSTEEFFPFIKEEKIIVILDDMIKKSGIQCDSIGLSEPSNSKISKLEKADKKLSEIESIVEKYKNLEKNTLNKDEAKSQTKSKEDNEKSKKNSSEIEKFTVSINFKGDYEKLISFMDLVKGYYKKIIITNVNLSADKDKISGSIALDFYALPKISEKDSEYLKWDYKASYGKTNPFMSNSTGTVSVKDNESLESDFSLTVRPISSDLPTIILGKTDDSDSSTYVYADNEGVEEIEFYITEKQGKYYYKYKTKNQSYPENFNDLGVNFIPKGDKFRLDVYSVARNSDKDVSGVNLKIYNDTNKAIEVNIDGDDKARKRVNLVQEKGIVSMKTN